MTSPFDQVLHQVARERWASDDGDEATLRELYAERATLIVREGDREVVRVSGRDQVVPFIVRSFRPNMIHHPANQFVEPAEDGMLRCRSYVVDIFALPAGGAEVRGYGKYHDLWVLEDDVWRLLERDVHLFGISMGGRG